MTASATRRDVRGQISRTLQNLPPFSPVLTRVMATLAREDVSFAKLADLIEKDTVLAGNILRLVNSALYGRRGTVNSVRHAVHLLGLAKLRNATLTMSVTRLWNGIKVPSGWSMPRFNQHSAATAILCDVLSQTLPVNHPESAFAAGLFHDLGRLLVAVGLPEEYARIERMRADGEGSRAECEEQVLGCAHGELSAEALAEWNLPGSIQTAVRFHHAPECDATPAQAGEFRLSAILHAAGDYVNRAGNAIDARPPRPASGQSGQSGPSGESGQSGPSGESGQSGAEPPALEALGIGDRLPRLIEEFESEFEAIKSFF